MRGTSHLIVGATTGMAISYKFNMNPLIAVGLSTIGSIIVDLDEQHSMINKVLFPVPLRYKAYIKLLIGVALAILPYPIVKYLGAIILLSIVSGKVELRFSLFSGIEKRTFHRTIFHDPIIGTILFATPLYALHVRKEYIIIYLIGVASHYIMDMFTTYGLPLYIVPHKKILRFPIHFDSRNVVAEGMIIGLYTLFMLSYTNGFKYMKFIATANEIFNKIIN